MLNYRKIIKVLDASNDFDERLKIKLDSLTKEYKKLIDDTMMMAKNAKFKKELSAIEQQYKKKADNIFFQKTKISRIKGVSKKKIFKDFSDFITEQSYQVSNYFRNKHKDFDNKKNDLPFNQGEKLVLIREMERDLKDISNRYGANSRQANLAKTALNNAKKAKTRNEFIGLQKSIANLV